MKEKFIQFMQGRYGVYGPDLMNRSLMISAMVTLAVSMLTGWGILYGISFLLIIYVYFRMFSKNYSKRYAENQVFLKATSKMSGFWASQKSMMHQRRTHHIYKCPGCRQRIRIPRGKGRIAVRCPKCGREFIRRS